MKTAGRGYYGSFINDVANYVASLIPPDQLAAVSNPIPTTTTPSLNGLPALPGASNSNARVPSATGGPITTTPPNSNTNSPLPSPQWNPSMAPSNSGDPHSLNFGEQVLKLDSSLALNFQPGDPNAVQAFRDGLGTALAGYLLQTAADDVANGNYKGAWLNIVEAKNAQSYAQLAPIDGGGMGFYPISEPSPDPSRYNQLLRTYPKTI